MQDDTATVVDRVQSHPGYQALRRKRNRFGWTLTLLMLAVYYGYIGLIAFDKPFLARAIGTGVTSIGIPIGLGVIVFTIVITLLYIRRANGEYDRETARILQDATR
ncbi:DUF485 domain-containing protein [Pseudorhodoferax sp. Leaf274]|uniref:DUF485 domain-containing protein n=1 Tax=Pseudorhodoferax sp. Leaf274 TaxID=1736318 RepID=UPI0007038930|nr:DUF485 domain-containing protein [Pseudorhodoferax sp. Leaf274]KQP38797.1 hypothetical protein ASF44_10135 [Pseudorhodoferax sp. Leaf274]